MFNDAPRPRFSRSNHEVERERQMRGNGGYESQPKQQPKTSGHDTVIRAIQSQERQVTVGLMSGEVRTGVIVGRDKYTITVKGSDGVRRVIFKHAIEEFYAEETSGAAQE